MERFDGKVALVTGAGMGIGRAVALALAAEGAAVGVFDLDADAARETTGAIEAGGGRALALLGDAGDDADVRRAVTGAAEAFGGVDLLASVAGVIRFGTVEELDEATWDLVMDTNAKGVFLFAKHAIPHLRARGGGSIVNVASVLAFASQAGVAAYCASKGAVVAMTRTMALDHAREGIRVNAVAPGSVRTPLLRYGAELSDADDPEAAMERLGELHPMGRLIEPDEVARLVLFLLSDDASAVTGGCHLVDNGLLAKLAA